ncbi:ubiquitin carboxyl-terminal hydrolase 32 [Anopheles bellator]|uniref:ubiquitin carboxyl-terminal hydrolase 32 n=1 Tax=Anopheles bellator TaxID=139047 RepID=UPI00264A43CC|nr:ubiquitin carboxyl-terminal hydrolase 32 [Anopheles bellator]
MGAKDSKPCCICYEDAVKRVTDLELRRIKDAFKRSAGTSGSVLSKSAFVQDVLGDGVPPLVADKLYSACGGSAKGIAFKELLCGLVLLTKGTQDEKIKFLWTLYCHESGTHILKQEFQNAIQIETTYQSNANGGSNHTNCSSTVSNNNSQLVVNRNNYHQQTTTGTSSSQLSQWNRTQVALFGQSDRVGFEQFKSWIQMHRGATALSKWLLLDACVNLSSELETPTFYQSLAGVTHLEEQDIGDLEKVFWLLKGAAITGQLDLESLGPLVSPPVPRSALGGVFLAFDENHDGHIDFKELCCGVSAACRGPSVERSKFCFKVFDIDRDGVLNFAEIRQMVDILLSVGREANANGYRNFTADKVLAELYRRTREPEGASDDGGGQSALQAVPEFKFSQEDFLIWSIESSAVNLVQPFLDLLFEVCHIVLGLRPQCRHLEGDIVRGWLTREVRRGYKVGQFWYLVSSDWWQHWSQYTVAASPGASSCVHCKSTGTAYASQRGGSSGGPGSVMNGVANGAVDEAMICDESFTSNSTESMGDLLGVGGTCGDSSSLGSGSSGISYGRHAGSAPGTIDNSGLIAPHIFKQIPTLTGEGGRLKRDATLVQHRDFELVPDSLWKALAQWYGGPLPLPRQVIQPNGSGEVELELYPLNLRILRHQSQTAAGQQQHQGAGGSSAWASMSGGYGALTTGSYSTSVSSAVLQPPKKYLAYTAAFSRLATVKQVGEFLCQRLKLRVEDIRLWHLVPTPTGISEFPYLLEEDQLTLSELSIADSDQILLEIRNKDLTWPEELGSLALTQQGGSPGPGGNTSMERRGTVSSIQSQHPPGATGLHNLGNTCFMNAALQVLFNTQPLTQYFIKRMHLYELNTVNKMGTKGQLVVRYAELLRDVWTASTRSIAPLKLRFCVTKHAPQFSGGGQHDSQELLDWLLDSLHEDLNRVMEKPYSELKDSDGRSDVIVAAEAWNQHHARNQSIIVDLFYGQLKSKVTCQGCGRDSVRFDPFSLLSLPLPVENYTYCEVLVMLLDGSVPVKYGLRLNSEMKYWDLKKQLSELCTGGLEPEQMLICELSNSQIRFILPNEHRIKASTACELYVYELPKVDSGVLRSRAGSELGINIEKGLKDIQRNQALLLPSLDPQQLTTSSINTTLSSVSSSSSSSSSSSTGITDDTAAITGRKPMVTGGAGPVAGRSGGPESGAGVALANGAAGGGTSNGATLANRRTSATSKVSRCFGNTLCMPPNMLCFKHIAEVSASPESTFIYGGGQYSELTTAYANNGYNGGYSSNANNFINNQQQSQQPSSRDPNRSKTISSANLLSNVDNGWHSANGYDLPGHHHRHHQPYEPCADCDNNLYMMMGEGDALQHHPDTISLSAISKRPPLPMGSHHPKANYLIAVHRKLSRQDTYFLSHHKSKPGLFGVPLLIPCYEGVTNKELYCSVWLQVARLLSPLPPTPPDQSNHATDCDDSLGYDFPFTLRAVASGGRMCALCPWSRFCRGCEIPCNDEPLLQGLICSGFVPPGVASNSSTPNLSSREQTPTFRRKVYATNSSGSSSLDGAPQQSSAVPSTPLSSLQSSINARSIQIAIDWDPTALHLRYQSTRERLWTEHESVAVCRRQQTEPVDLDHCLRAFTSEEKLEQWYHCSHCKQKKPATKKLQIWKLPPILIVHLKRFNYVNGKWVKSQKVVNFPYEGFDPTPYLASVPQETILRHRDLLEGVLQRGDGRNRDCHEEFVEFDREMSMIDEASDEVSMSSLCIDGGGGSKDDDGAKSEHDHHQQRSSIIVPAIAGTHHVASVVRHGSNETDPPTTTVGAEDVTDCAGGARGATPSGATGGNLRSKSATSVHSSDSTRRQRLISTSLTKTPVIDGELTDFHQHPLKPGCDPFELKYQLYAAVCHSGMLNGGHYISYAANPNGSWYCYNDSSCREIPTRPKIDPSTAYLLFYERRDLDYGPFLPKVDGRQLPSEHLLDTDDSDNDLKKMCSLM